MKKMKKSIFLLLQITMSFLLLVSCEEKSNVSEIESFELSQLSLIAPQDDFLLALDSDNRQEILRFEWEPSVASNGFLVTYSLMIDLHEANFSDPLLTLVPSNNGTSTFAEVTYARLDQALSDAGFSPSEEVRLKWGVMATSIGQTSLSSFGLSLQRFDIQGPPTDLFIAGTATEVGPNVENALALNRLSNADGSLSNVFETFTSLVSGNTYNFYSARTIADATVYTANGEAIELGNTGIVAPESGVYRVTVNFDTESFSLLRINSVGIIGNVINPAWSEERQLEYQGNGVYKSTIELVDGAPDDSSKRFVIRANQDWGQAYKNTPGSNSAIALEATSGDFGFNGLDDVAVSQLGFQEITISFNGDDGYAINIQPGTDPGDDTTSSLTIPETLYIAGNATENGADLSTAQLLHRLPLANGQNSNIFEIYTTLTQNETYNFYSTTGGDAITYGLNGTELVEDSSTIMATDETAVYRVTVDFDAATVSTFRINTWAIIGNVVEQAWSDEAVMDYQGNGVWQLTLELVDAAPDDATKRFIFRANGDWGLLNKEIPGSNGQLALEGTAGAFGFTGLDDILVSNLGTRTVTLNLNGINGYSYTIE